MRAAGFMQLEFQRRVADEARKHGLKLMNSEGAIFLFKAENNGTAIVVNFPGERLDDRSWCVKTLALDENKSKKPSAITHDTPESLEEEIARILGTHEKE